MNDELLFKIAEAVTKSDKDRGKLHQVFERSFDCKEITNQHFFMQKLSYIHNNPCSGLWLCKALLKRRARAIFDKGIVSLNSRVLHQHKAWSRDTAEE